MLDIKHELQPIIIKLLAEIDKKLPDVAILDVKLDKGDNDGIELLSHIKTKNKRCTSNNYIWSC
jgi:CheY-like chemotaxis protein